jgi:hypothetical protein
MTISNRDSLVYIVNLINGKLRGPKIYTFHKLIEWLNSNMKLNIEKLNVNSNSLFEDSWFAGFTDVEGCFYIRYTPLTFNSKRRIACRFTLEQRLIDPLSKITYLTLFMDIARFLKTKLNVRNQSKSNCKYYIISASNLNSLPIIIDYFTLNPLFSFKYLDYKDWSMTANHILHKTHYNNSEFIQKLKSNMNNNRTYFNWDHLNKLV